MDHVSSGSELSVRFSAPIATENVVSSSISAVAYPRVRMRERASDWVFFNSFLYVIRKSHYPRRSPSA